MTHDFGRFTWHELVTTDVEDSKGFYGELLGWKFEAMPMPTGTYTIVKLGDASIGGITPPPEDGVPPHWIGYVSVEDVDKSAKAILKAGGESLMDAFDVPGVGRMQPVRDPHGSAFFLFRSAEGDPEPATGAGAWHWNELWAKDAGEATAFYEKTLGYSRETMPMPNGDYHILKNGEQSRGGVMTAPEGAPPHWAFYVEVADVDATVAKAKKLGGKAIGELMDVPGVGRFGFVSDRSGATIGVITPAK
ncbi:MAG: VOC family protein [Myxococcota bacterium]